MAPRAPKPTPVAEPEVETARYVVVTDRCILGAAGEVVTIVVGDPLAFSLVRAGHLEPVTATEEP